MQLPCSQWLYKHTQPDRNKQPKLIDEAPLRSSIE